MENCWEPSPHSSQDYYPHYNLFQSSIFYDTDNFRVRCLLEDCVPSESSENEEKSAEPPDKPPEAPPVRTRRVIEKQELYRDPDTFGKEYGQTNTNGPIEPPQPWGYDWTKQSWVKEGVSAADSLKEDRRTPEHQPLAPRVNNSKAESMMHKMGWQGGALGKTGDGITEPITPKAIHAFRPSPGPGTRAGKKPGKTPTGKTPPGKSPQGKKNQNMRETFRTNTLMHILEFVQDDTESELLFDPSLRQHERRNISHIVNSVVNNEVVHSLGSAAQYDLARDIHKSNKYLLECAADNNQLGIYKEAPEDVYLVTPDDFLSKDDTDDKNTDDTNDTNDSNDTKVNGELEDDENPFLKSIKKSIKKDDEPKLTNKFETDCVIAKESESKDEGSKEEIPAADKMLEFFLEFAESQTYKEMWFLGTFTESQSSAIDALLSDVAARPAEHPRGAFQVRDGANGTPEIHKVPSNTKRNVEKT